MDRILNCKSGIPLTISDKDVSVRAPSALPGDNDDDPTAADTLALYTHLSRILGRIAKRVYRRPRARAALETAVVGVMGELAAWEKALSGRMRVDFARGVGPGLRREQVSVYLHYHQCVIMAVRPLMLGIVAERLRKGAEGGNWKRGVDTGTVGVVEECMRAARNSVALLASAASRNLVGSSSRLSSCLW